jgi:hypothetical protein
MKHPPKPFAVEIKRSRRPSAPAAAPGAAIDVIAKDKVTRDRKISGAFFGAGGFSIPASVAEFAVPTFLQTDKGPQRAPIENFSKEAAQVFTPKPPAAAESRQAEMRPEPRILPSLVPPAAAAPDSGRADEASARTPYRARKPQEPKPVHTAPVEGVEPRAKRRSRDVSGDASDLGNQRRKAAARGGATARAGAEAAATVPDNAGESAAAHPSGNWRGLRSRSLTRRSRANVAALPPGQHWKRRLNPRAW